MQSFASSSFSEIKYLFLFSITIRQKHDNKLDSSKCLYEFETLYFINKTFELKNFHFLENVKMLGEKKLKIIIVQC